MEARRSSRVGHGWAMSYAALVSDAPVPRTNRRSVKPTGDPELDARISEHLAALHPVDRRIALETLQTVFQLSLGSTTRLDRKITKVAIAEMLAAFDVFGVLRDRRKVTVFGSARTKPDDQEFETARVLGREMAKRNWLVITGAGPGIMEAAHEGAETPNAVGVGISLPFEATANPIIAGDPKLVNFKFFFTRKLMFVKEADAFVLLPGGFGTLDEAFELLTLIQTGKSDLHPIVLLDAPGGTFWESFEDHIRRDLLAKGFVDESDLALFTRTDDVHVAVREIERFYRAYHSERYVDGRLILRLNQEPDPALLEELSREFADMMAGPLERAEASPAEIRDEDVPDLPRVAVSFGRVKTGRLRQMIDRLNDAV